MRTRPIRFMLPVLMLSLRGSPPIGAAETLVINDFEDGSFSGWVWGNGPGKMTEMGVSQEKAHGGKGSLKLSWDFGPKPEAGQFTAVGHGFAGHGVPIRYTLWIHGDKSGRAAADVFE